jgi:cytochrome P450
MTTTGTKRKSHNTSVLQIAKFVPSPQHNETNFAIRTLGGGLPGIRFAAACAMERSMTSVLARRDPAAPLYPPTVAPRRGRLSLPRFLFTFVRNPLRVLPEAVYREPIFQYGDRVTWVTDPALIKTVLLDARDSFAKTPLERRVLGPLLGKGILISDGVDWRWQRQTAAPLFRHADVLRYVPAMIAAADETIADWRASAPGATQRVDENMTKATFRVISETMLPGGDTYVGPALERSNLDYLLPISWPIAYAVVGLPAWLPFPGRAGMRRAEQRMRLAVADMIRARRDNASDRDDLFARLLRAKDPETGRPMGDEQLVDNLLTFLLAGHETTAKALTWALYLVARAPDWEARMVDEIRRVAGDAPIAPEHIEHLVDVTKVVKEAMRLYPPAPVLTRITTRDLELGGKQLAAGSLVVLPIFAIHRHRQQWNDPDRFDPDRFSPEREAQYSRYQFMPFGAGPRICIGASFAMIEATAMLATFVRAAHFEVPAGHTPTPISRVTLRPRGGMPLEVWPRESLAPIARAA